MYGWRVEGRTEERIDEGMEGWMDTEGRIDGEMEGWMDTEGRIDEGMGGEMGGGMEGGREVIQLDR